jgi:hypothetical protein
LIFHTKIIAEITPQIDWAIINGKPDDNRWDHVGFSAPTPHNIKTPPIRKQKHPIK